MKSFKEYARHIQEETALVINQCHGLSFADFLGDEILKRAVVRSLEIIGEAVKNIPLEIKQNYSGTDWKNIARLRDRLIHHYFSIDYEIVWNIVEKHLPSLKSDIEKMIE
ncbi:MAG: DUF86 domain-containing protein [Spirochaetaceae bacterium]|nr:MAG: DUF86 domain-containing protein [Spirochaetaceae bacterium]